ncbi:MAG: DUF7512 family protein [Natrialbaceae archaeon]
MIESLPIPMAAQALLLVFVVFVEAVVLYVGYGYVEQLAAPVVFEKIERI